MTNLQVWDMYFAGITSMQYHPANKLQRLENEDLIKFCADIADLMIIERTLRWPGSQQQ